MTDRIAYENEIPTHHQAAIRLQCQTVNRIVRIGIERRIKSSILPSAAVPFRDVVGGESANIRECSPDVNIGAIHRQCQNLAADSRIDPHADPIRIAEGGIDADEVDGGGIVHPYGQAVPSAGFEAGAEFAAGGVGDTEAAVGEFAVRSGEDELRTVGGGSRAGTGEFQGEFEFAGSSGLFGNHEILADAVHAGGVFFGEGGAEVGGGAAGDGYLSGSRERDNKVPPPYFAGAEAEAGSLCRRPQRRWIPARGLRKWLPQ